MSKEKNVKKPQFILWMRFIWAFLERQDRIWLKIINLEKVTCGFWFASFYVVCVQLCVYLCAMHWITLQKFLYHCNLTRRLDVRPLNTSRTSQNRIFKICFIYIHFSYRTFYLDFNYLTTSVFFSSLCLSWLTFPWSAHAYKINDQFCAKCDNRNVNRTVASKCLFIVIEMERAFALYSDLETFFSLRH